MFFPSPSPSQPDPKRLSALRVSLNAPVVSVEGLPPGPARAAIAMWWELDQSCALEVRLRSQTTGDLLAYAFNGPLDEAAEVDHALEAALNFSESMGFLFDDDILSGEDTIGREAVFQAWSEFEGTAEEVSPALAAAPVAADPLAASLPRDLEPPEPAEVEPLELTDLAEDDLADLGEPPDLDPVEEPPAGPVLTKFRTGSDPAPGGNGSREPVGQASPPEPPPSGRAELGRVPLVRRKGRKPARERPGLLVRILGAF